MSVRLGLIGGRGHTGREILRLLSRRTDLSLVLASSRELAGRPVRETAPELETDLTFEAVSPEALGEAGLDAVILALPNTAAAPFVAQLRTWTIVVDLSADYRFDDDWVYGLPEIHGRSRVRKARRIANPGCYATCGQLAIAPMRDGLAGPAHVFGVSGYSGAGTTPSRKNDLSALADNLMPYALTGHIHEREMSRHLGCEVRFSPHVAPFFSGLSTTVQLTLAQPMTLAEVTARYTAAYGEEALVSVIDAMPEPAMIAQRPGALVGGFSLSDDGRQLALVSVLDNLQKGAAVQAIQNLCLALGLPEHV